MALDLSVEYPGQVATGDAGYPYGKAQNETVEGDGTGTPWEQELVKDFTGWQQALMSKAGLTPTGTPDQVGASQYLEAIFRIFQPLAVLDWSSPVPMNLQNILPLDPASNKFGITIAVNINDLDVDKLTQSVDGGNLWADVTLASPTGVNFLAVALDPDGSKGIATGSKAGGTDIQICSTLATIPIGAWTAITPPGAPESLASALFDPVNSRFIVTGRDGAAPYIATAELADLTTWTQRTVPASITGDKESLGIARIGDVIVASWEDQTKIAVSSDGGATWVASTSNLTSGQYVVCAGETHFLAVDKTSGRVYKSDDGMTWTLQTAFPRVEVDFRRYDLQFIGRVFLIRPPAGEHFYYSTDYGDSWIRVLSSDRLWGSWGVVRDRLVQFRYLPNGSDIDVWIERSRPTGLPVGVTV